MTDITEKFWEAGPKAGRPAAYTDPEKMWSDAVEYFQWAQANPFETSRTKRANAGGEAKEVVTSKPRVMTLNGLQIFLGMCKGTWQNYSKKPEFLAITARIHSIIYEQKFAGAAADLFNPMIISRDLGLADKRIDEVKVEDSPLSALVDEIRKRKLNLGDQPDAD